MWHFVQAKTVPISCNQISPQFLLQPEGVESWFVTAAVVSIIYLLVSIHSHQNDYMALPWLNYVLHFFFLMKFRWNEKEQPRRSIQQNHNTKRVLAQLKHSIHVFHSVLSWYWKYIWKSRGSLQGLNYRNKQQVILTGLPQLHRGLAGLYCDGGLAVSKVEARPVDQGRAF